MNFIMRGGERRGGEKDEESGRSGIRIGETRRTRSLDPLDWQEESIGFVDYSRTGIELLNCQSGGEPKSLKKKERKGEGEGERRACTERVLRTVGERLLSCHQVLATGIKFPSKRVNELVIISRRVN